MDSNKPSETLEVKKMESLDTKISNSYVYLRTKRTDSGDVELTEQTVLTVGSTVDGVSVLGVGTTKEQAIEHLLNERQINLQLPMHIINLKIVN